jgi:hypothetical protein
VNKARLGERNGAVSDARRADLAGLRFRQVSFFEW